MTFAFVFPGQGSQSVGMLNSIAQRPEVRATLQEASDALGEDVAKLIAEGPAEALSLTTNTQPVMLTAAIAFYRAWLDHGWRAPAKAPKDFKFAKPKSTDRNFPDWPAPDGFGIPPAGEVAALERWKVFKKTALDSYDEQRNFAGVDGTSKLSHHLKFGEIHPRTLLADLNKTKAHEVYRKEIAWREFYADVLFHNPHTDNDYYSKRFLAKRR